MKASYSYITDKNYTKELKHICEPKCSELPQSYLCLPARIHEGICSLQDCTSHNCSTLGRIQCQQTIEGMKWGTIDTGEWMQIKNFNTTIQTACTIPITCPTLEKLDNNSKWDNCEPCEYNSYKLYTECKWVCPLIKMSPRDDIHKPPDVIATCQENGRWTIYNNGQWVDSTKDIITNGSYCPGKT